MNKLNELTVDVLTQSTVKDLLVLQKHLNEALDLRKASEKKDLLEQISSLASESGYSLDELLNQSKKKPKTKVAIKYRDPNNSANAWTGRGRKPNWVQDLIDSGKKLEDFEA